MKVYGTPSFVVTVSILQCLGKETVAFSSNFFLSKNVVFECIYLMAHFLHIDLLTKLVLLIDNNTHTAAALLNFTFILLL